MNTPALVEALLAGLVDDDDAAEAYPDLGALCLAAAGYGAPVPRQWALALADLPLVRGLLRHSAEALLDLLDAIDAGWAAAAQDDCPLWHTLRAAPPWLLRPGEELELATRLPSGPWRGAARSATVPGGAPTDAGGQRADDRHAEYHEEAGAYEAFDECAYEGLHVYGARPAAWEVSTGRERAGDGAPYEGLHPDIDLLLERDRDYGGDWQTLIEALHRAGSATWQWAIRRCRAMQRFEAREQVSLRALLAGLVEPGAGGAPGGATAEAAPEHKCAGVACAQAPHAALPPKEEPR